jgi:CTP:molybdopterin cytidylyltransferase MocA
VPVEHRVEAAVRRDHLDVRAVRHHDACVRTTLTLDPDVAKLLEDTVHRTRRPLKTVVNDALRRGLATSPRAGVRRRVRVEPHRSALRPGFDLAGFNKLADELEDEAVVAKARRRR